MLEEYLEVDIDSDVGTLASGRVKTNSLRQQLGINSHQRVFQKRIQTAVSDALQDTAKHKNCLNCL